MVFISLARTPTISWLLASICCLKVVWLFVVRVGNRVETPCDWVFRPTWFMPEPEFGIGEITVLWGYVYMEVLF